MAPGEIPRTAIRLPLRGIGGSRLAACERAPIGLWRTLEPNSEKRCFSECAVCRGISSKMRMPTPCAWQASLPIFGWGMRTHATVRYFTKREVRLPSPGEIPRTGHQGKKIRGAKSSSYFLGDPYGNRTHVTAVKGPCLNRLTNGPKENVQGHSLVAEVGFEPTTCRV